MEVLGLLRRQSPPSLVIQGRFLFLASLRGPLRCQVGPGPPLPAEGLKYGNRTCLFPHSLRSFFTKPSSSEVKSAHRKT